MGDQSKMPVPTGVKYLVCTQFLLRISVKGTQAVLVLFLFDHVGLSQNLSAELVHIFLTVMNFGPVLGAVLSDGYLGKYRAFLCLLLVQLAGMVTLVSGAMSSVETGGRILMASISALGLLLVALGVGGIKPIILALGGDQIEVLVPDGTERDRLTALFFSLWYIGGNSGSLLATVAIPPLRTLGSYAFIFSVQTGVLGVSILMYWLGKSHYAHRPVKENIFVKVGAIITDALKVKTKKRPRNLGARELRLPDTGEQEPMLRGNDVVDNGPLDIATVDSKHHWLDGAKLKHDATSVGDVKLLLRVLILFTPMPVFWALFEQQYTKWVFQARAMNLEVSWLGGLVLEPEQIQGLNPLLVLIIIPILDKAIYPFLRKLNIPSSPLRRMVMGMASAVLAFIASGVLQLAMDSSLKSSSTGQTATVSVFWQVPQYTFITLAEVLINVTGLEFAYSQAPSSMKSLLQGSWQSCQAIGDFMTAVIIALIGDRLSKANEFFLFAGGCAAAMLWLVWISQGYDDRHCIVTAVHYPMLAETTHIASIE